MSEHILTIISAGHAVQAILDLINSSPRSPTMEQMAAILDEAETRRHVESAGQVVGTRERK
jgi:hypothetical protein